MKCRGRGSIPVSENGVYSVHQFAGSTTLIAAAAPGSAGPADLAWADLGREYKYLLVYGV